MSYLFKKRVTRTKARTEAKTVENNGFKSADGQVRTQPQNQQTAMNSYSEAKKLRRVQLRGWK